MTVWLQQLQQITKARPINGPFGALVLENHVGCCVYTSTYNDVLYAIVPRRHSQVAQTSTDKLGHVTRCEVALYDAYFHWKRSRHVGRTESASVFVHSPAQVSGLHFLGMNLSLLWPCKLTAKRKPYNQETPELLVSKCRKVLRGPTKQNLVFVTQILGQCGPLLHITRPSHPCLKVSMALAIRRVPGNSQLCDSSGHFHQILCKQSSLFLRWEGKHSLKRSNI